MYDELSYDETSEGYGPVPWDERGTPYPEAPADAIGTVEQIVVSAEMIDDAMRSLARLTKWRDSIGRRAERLINAERDRINAWRDETLGDTDTKISNMEMGVRALVEEYVAARKTKTVTTPWGTVATRRATSWYMPDDPTALRDWLAARAPKLIVTPEPKPVEPSIDKTAFKKACTVLDNGDVLLDGETVPGVAAYPTVNATITLAAE